MLIMKKILIISLAILTPFVLIGSILAFSIFTGRFDKGINLETFGSSMEDYGMSAKSKYKIYTLLEKCDVGKNCAFKCLNAKCINGTHDKFIKHLAKKENNCYWFEGNIDKSTSWDSRWYGWLCKDELEIIGVVK